MKAFGIKPIGVEDRSVHVQADIAVRSISEYVEQVTSISKAWCDGECDIAPWFRGIGHCDEFQLVPRLYREPRINYLKEEAKIRVAFSSRALPYLAGTQKREPWDWYFLMQHYGVPTRLLDWTESPLVALYFALYSRKGGLRSMPAVWVLDPFALNQATLGSDIIVVPDDDSLARHLPKCGSDVQAPLPIAIHPDYADRRMNAQHSKFTMHGSVATPLEDIPEVQALRKSGRLVRILIHADDDTVEEFKDSLAQLGVRSATVFQDLEGLAKDIRRDHTPMQE